MILERTSIERWEGPAAVRRVRPESEAWCELARHSPQATVFHQPEWAEVIRRTYGLAPHYFLLERPGEPASGVPFFQAGGLLRRRLISLPFSDAAGPLLASPQDGATLLRAVLAAAAAARAAQVEVRGGHLEEVRGFQCSTEFCGFVVGLEEDLATLRRRLQKSSTQRSLRLAEHGPLAVRLGRGEEEMRAFHRLNLITRRSHGVPPQPYRLFRNIWRVMGPAGQLTLLLAELGDTPVAGLVLFHFGDTAYYKYGASDLGHLRLRPNHLLMWRAIEWAKEQGYRRLDLGRTYVGNQGLMRYKRSWGARQVPLPYWRWPAGGGRGLLAEGSRGYELITRCWRRLPLRATELGSLLYKFFA